MGKGSNTVTTKPDPTLMKYYQQVVGRADKTSQIPFKPYAGQMVAPLSALEKQAQAGVGAAANTYQPYFTQAQQYATQAAAPISPMQWSSGALDRYMNPYQRDVINATMGNIRENNAQQQQGVIGNAIMSGAWGGDRSAVAQSELARQQDLASNATLAGLNAQNYSQAQQEFNTQQGVDLSAAQMNAQNAANAGNTYGNLGVAAQNSALAGIGAEAKLGAEGRQVAQASDTAKYQQYLNQQAYPFQSTQFLSNIVEGIGGQAGGSTTSPAPSALSQIGGIALGGLGLAGQYGMFANRGGGIRRGFADGGAPSTGDFVDDDFVDKEFPMPKAQDLTGISQPITGGAQDAINAMAGPPKGKTAKSRVDPITGIPYDQTNAVPLRGSGNPPSGGNTGSLFGGGADTTALPLSSRDKWGGLAALGFGMAAGDSPFAGVNIGKGGLAAEDFMSKQRQLAVDNAYRVGQLGVAQRGADTEANRLMAESQHWDQEFKTNQQKVAAERFSRQSTPAGMMVIDTWDPDAAPKIIPWNQIAHPPTPNAPVVTTPSSATPPPAAGAPPPGTAAPAVVGAPPPKGTPPPAAADPFASVTNPPPDLMYSSLGDPMTMSKMGQAETQAQTIDTMKEAKTAYNASVAQEGLISGMERDAAQLPDEGIFSQGAFANQRLSAGRALSSLARDFSLDPKDFGLDPEQIAAGEDMFKDATRLGFQLAKTLGSREAMQIVQAAIGAVPGMENTPLGFKRIVAGLRATIDHDKDYYVAASNYQKTTGGSLNGFDEWFNSANPPAKYAARELLKTASVPVTPGDVKYLQDHPDAVSKFDEKFGGGLGEVVLEAVK